MSIPHSDACLPSPLNVTHREYVPPRNNWATGGRGGTPPVPPINTANFTNSPVELPTAFSSNSPTRVPKAGYYEDVDPRFAEKNPAPPTEIPASLIPGYSGNLQIPGGNPQSGQPRPSDVDDGNRSPAASITSNFTSVSQRPVNPNWNPTGPAGSQSVAPRRPTPQQQAQERDIIDSNPGFQISADRGTGRGINLPGQIPGTGDPGRYPGPEV